MGSFSSHLKVQPMLSSFWGWILDCTSRIRKSFLAANRGQAILVVAIVLALSASLPHLEACAGDFSERVDRYCLALSYPEMEFRDNGGKILLKNGKLLDYGEAGGARDNLNGSLPESLEQIYPLEPERPETREGFNPGRKRPYAFYNEFYGRNPEELSGNLAFAALLGKRFYLANQAARAFASVAPKLEELAIRKPQYKKFLKPEGGYYWRKIAGEKHLSAHAYGIALDIGVQASPYWRWSRKMPHPLQKDYSSEIVKIFEDNGFIWGGKWRQYDIMHYEYRPELICKARMLKFREKPFNVKIGQLKGPRRQGTQTREK